LIPVALLALMLISFRSVDSRTGKVYARRLFAINASDQLPVP
jgi:hypothetical protein